MVTTHCQCMDANERYVIRPTDTLGEWQVWDTHTDAVVFGAESMTESGAINLARRLNEVWRQWRDGGRAE